jgi:hypothetical protein
MAHIWDEDFADMEDSSGSENDFESFLRKKVERCIQDKPASQLNSIPALDVEVEVKPATSIPIQGIVQREEPSSALVVENIGSRDVKVTELSTKTSDLGTRKEELLVEEQKVLQVDEEWVRISNESFTIAVVNLSCEQVIAKFHDLNRLRFLIPAQQYGLQKALEELLKSRNAEDRAKLLEMDKAYRSKQKARSATSGERKEKKPKEPKEKKAVASASFKATPATKAIDMLKSLGFDKGYILNNLMERGLMDKLTGAYLAKVFDIEEVAK